jgi:DNA mismatch repair protein MutS2
MDAHTLELLEFPKVRQLLAGYAATSLGKELALQLHPLADLDRIREAQQLTTEMTELLAAGMTPPLGGLADVRMLVRRATIGSQLTAEELLQIKEVLLCTGNVYRYRMRLTERAARLVDLLTRVEDLGGTAKVIEGCLDPRGNVLDMASPELAAVRQQLRELDERIQARLRALLRDPEIRKVLRFPNATVSGDHHVLPVAVNFRHKVPGVVHRTSSTGDTVYIEPAGVAQISAERALLKREEEKEIARVLRQLTAAVVRIAKPALIALDILAHLDLLCAKGRYSLDYRMNPPDINGQGRLWLRQARHPLLEHIFRQPVSPPQTATEPRSVVPVDVRLGMEFDLLVITGPNTGGKTVVLKTVGLLSLMALSGMHIPAEEGSAVPLLEHILADIGDEQSLEQSLSTFSSHISHIAEILSVCNPRSLVLFDELGAGTDPMEGSALGRAILDQLRHCGCRAIVTTHLGDLKTYAFHDERTENAAVEFDVATLRPTYRLHIGQFGMSNALRIARRLKMPKDLLQRAHKYLRKRQRRGGELEKLQRAREQAELARKEALQAELAARQERQQYEQRLTAIEKEAAAAEALRQLRENLKPGDTVRVAKLDRPGRIIRVDISKGLAVVKAGLGQWEVPLQEVFPVEQEP